jgi:orotate phosphoribosyltransferase
VTQPTADLAALQAALTNAVLHRDPATDEPFILKSGAKAWWYLDCRPVTFGFPRLVGKAVLDHLNYTIWGSIPYVDEAPQSYAQHVIDAVGGPAIGAVPIATSMAMALECRSFAVRPEAKDHGASGDSLIVGALEPGDKVIVVEDVFTSGGSLLSAMRAVNDAGAFVLAAVVLLYRGILDAESGRPPQTIIMPTTDPLEGQEPEVPFLQLFTPADLGLKL